MAESLGKASESCGKVLDIPLKGLEGRSLAVEGVDGAFDGIGVAEIGRLQRVLERSAYVLGGSKRMTDRAA